MNLDDKIILSLCDFSGVWSKPYKDAGYKVIQLDLQHGDDIRLFYFPGKVHGILAAPPCTEFARSGCCHWQKKDSQLLLNGLALIDACLRFVVVCEPNWWALENPVGRLKNWLGPYQYKFHPYYFAKDFPQERYPKLTTLFGKFNNPIQNYHEYDEALKNKIAFTPDTKNRKNLRSQTPQGFAEAFFRANP